MTVTANTAQVRRQDLAHAEIDCYPLAWTAAHADTHIHTNGHRHTCAQASQKGKLEGGGGT